MANCQNRLSPKNNEIQDYRGTTMLTSVSRDASLSSGLRKLATATASALVLLAPQAFAGAGDPFVPSLNPWLSVNMGSSSGSDLLPASTANDGDNNFAFEGSNTATGQYAVSWDLTMNPDPFIDGFLTITNLSGSAQNFTVNLSVPVTPAFIGGLMGGSIEATIWDLNNSGSATLQPQTNVGNPIYFGRIDGVNVLPMFAQVVSCGSVGCSGNSGESQMPPSIPVAGVNSNIGTRLVFNLSGGDRVTFATHFEVLPVPVPASAWLMGSAILGLVGARRRR